MSEQEGLDIGRVVGLILENPQLIEQISSLARQKNDAPSQPKEEPVDQPQIQESEHVSAAPSSATYAKQSYTRGNRAQLLGALKPYVSEERAKAIDSMISIADILEMMRAR